MDEDSRMLAYIDEVIVGDRTSDAAEDSAGAAWAAYERGEFDVPAWFKPGSKTTGSNYSSSSSSTTYSYQSPKSNKLSFDLFLKAMGALFLILILLTFVLFLFGFCAG